MKISPSILDADFKAVQQDLDSIATADRIHLDVMDGQYVPNLSFGPPVLKNLNYPVEYEVHLMAQNPDRFVDLFCDMGVSTFTFHIETVTEEKALELFNGLKERGVKAGICIDGATPVSALSDEVLDQADQVLVMSVQAGFGGQSFMPESINKIKTLRARGFKAEIEVDGGVNLDNVKLLAQAGADIVVVGSALMKQPTALRANLITQFQSS
ncbi:ribulose-phosphate 3-epimerase [bacterium]|nr:ribulose-phosphate 3-epimerase [bacterium]NCQ55068.1 ribulose-phosphate 3-epimerase [Candidatus Parcubacteria bacterium]NCS67112.1 ribulose-phosphate 3-epimerase [Candidatus Peregrinibacteria bacterium]NCS96058.1 ribulose-phosphate 3-epimerase [bacterium]